MPLAPLAPLALLAPLAPLAPLPPLASLSPLAPLAPLSSLASLAGLALVTGAGKDVGVGVGGTPLPPSGASDGATLCMAPLAKTPAAQVTEQHGRS